MMTRVGVSTFHFLNLFVSLCGGDATKTPTFSFLQRSYIFKLPMESRINAIPVSLILIYNIEYAILL
jgi:hypothetical protein